MKLVRLDYVPDKMEPGTLYYSEKHEIAIHLCPCERCTHPDLLQGSKESVTPIRSSGWALTAVDEKPTLSPSILNYRCGAHYFIRDGEVVWA